MNILHLIQSSSNPSPPMHVRLKKMILDKNGGRIQSSHNPLSQLVSQTIVADVYTPKNQVRTTCNFLQVRGWGKQVSAKLLRVAQGTQITPLLGGGLPPLQLEILGPSEATPHFGTCLKSAHRVCGVLQDPEQIRDGSYSVCMAV